MKLRFPDNIGFALLKALNFDYLSKKAKPLEVRDSISMRSKLNAQSAIFSVLRHFTRKPKPINRPPYQYWIEKDRKTLFIIIFLTLICSQAFAYTNEEAVAITISAEASGEGYEGMYRVANTIANRAKLWHKTPYEIVSSKNQYYGYTAKNRIKLYKSVKKDADYLAKNIMTLKDKTNGAIYFRRPDEKMFKWCKIKTASYKNHIFYKEIQ
jgi:hypothetical protein